MTTTTLDAVTATIATQPARTPMIVRTATGNSTRRSQGRNDKTPAGTINYTTGIGFGIVDSSRKECRDGDWVIAMTVRPPETEAECTAIAREMVRRYTTETEYLRTSSPDDERDRPEWDKRVATNRQIVDALAKLVA